MSRVWNGNGALGGEASLTMARTDKPRCRASVHRADGWGFSQCQKGGKHQDAEGVWWCELHEPEREVAREKATRERQDAAYREYRMKNLYGWTGLKFRDALREIANGHNDPRSLARETLGDLLENDL